MTETPEAPQLEAPQPEAPQDVVYYAAATTEWETAFVAYRAAQARLAHAGAYMALRAWDELINPANFRRSLSRWLDRVTKIVRAFRARQRRLAQAYYQYGRALEIGETFGTPVDGSQPTLGNYRNAFLDQVQDAALLESRTRSDWDDRDDTAEIRRELQNLLSADDDEFDQRRVNFRSVSLDEAIQRFLDNWQAQDAEVDVVPMEWPDQEADNADEIHREVLQKEAERLWEESERDAEIEDEQEESEERDPADRRQSIIDRLNEASRNVGNRVAGRVMNATTHAADQVTNWAMDRDRRVYGVARGTGPNPCALCAIAASRGFVYHSVSSAMTTSSGGSFKRFHENCQCYPIIRWVPSQAEPETTRKWRNIYNAAASEGGNVFNNFRRRVHAETAAHVNARRRRYRERNKTRINARRRAQRRVARRS